MKLSKHIQRGVCIAVWAEEAAGVVLFDRFAGRGRSEHSQSGYAGYLNPCTWLLRIFGTTDVRMLQMGPFSRRRRAREGGVWALACQPAGCSE
jgi:hypothetical protein